MTRLNRARRANAGTGGTPTGKTARSSPIIAAAVPDADWQWSVAVLSSREDVATLSATLTAVLHACEKQTTTVDVLVNGNTFVAERLAKRLPMPSTSREKMARVRVWASPIADKASMWNLYSKEVRPVARLAFFVDGYARIASDSLEAIERALAETPRALAASAVPTEGPSARSLREAMLKNGGIHGNLYAVRGAVMDELRQRDFKLPLGIYRTDPLLAAVIAFNLDPTENEWDIRRIVVVPRATWSYDPPVMWHLADIRNGVLRYLRQSQGVLENLAVRDLLAIRRQAPTHFPRTVVDLLSSWSKKHPWSAIAACIQRPACLFALYRVVRSQNQYPPPSCHLLTEVALLPADCT